MDIRAIQNAISKLGKVKSNTLLPMTELIGVKVKDGNLTLVRTDGTNTIQTVMKIDCAEDIDVSVNANQFINLFKSLQDNIDIYMSVDNGNLVLRNNTMNFTLPAMCDETGEIKYPTIEMGEGKKFSIAKWRAVYNATKPCVDENNLTPKLRNIYFGYMKSFATNNYNLVSVKYLELFENPVLMPMPLCSLIECMESDEGEVIVDNLDIKLTDGITTIQGKLSDEVVSYPAEAMAKFFDDEGFCEFTIDTQKLVSAVNRVSVFCDDYVNKHLQLALNDGKLELKTKKGSGKEVLTLESVSKNENAKVILAVKLLQKFLKSYDTPTVTLKIAKQKLIGEKDMIQSLLLGVNDNSYE